MQVPFSRILGAYNLSVRHSYEEESGHDCLTILRKNGQLSDAGAFKGTKKKLVDLIQDPFDPYKIPLLAWIVYRLKFNLTSNHSMLIVESRYE